MFTSSSVCVVHLKQGVQLFGKMRVDSHSKLALHVCVTHHGAESSYLTKAVVFTSSHQQRQVIFHLQALSHRLFPLSLSHSATPTLPPQLHNSARSGRRVGVLLRDVLSSAMRLMWVSWLIHQSWGKGILMQ